jgi:GNAT superfamily N-acetyltransferase
MQYRHATDEDLDLLAGWNRQLIEDEGHRNAMDERLLRARMAGWLEGEYKAVIFLEAGGTQGAGTGRAPEPVAYALYCPGEESLYLRQFFVRRDRRREGLGRRAIELLRREIWPPDRRLTVDVLAANHSAVAFWRAVGYRDYSITLEIEPGLEAENEAAREPDRES